MAQGSPDQARREELPSSRSALIWPMFGSIILVMVVIFFVVQVVHPEAAGLSIVERLSLHRLKQEVGENWLWIVITVALLNAGIFLTLHIGLRPLRKISDRAALIGPSTINQRLPLSTTPREISPLVRSFNATLDRLEAGLRAQREFSANAAHELRTPLATLRVLVEGLIETDERQAVIEEFDHLSRLIAQLLTLAEADSGKDIVTAPFDLVERTRGLATDMARGIVASGRGIAFESAHEHFVAHGSPDLIEVAVRNLIENATRHTPPGSEIVVAIDKQGRLTVSDDGPGVPADFAERLFDGFSKADTNSSGAGLGLSIVKRIMTLHGGEVRLEPSAAGARFVLDFPTRQAA